MLNKNYGKPTQSSGIQYAPRQFVENGVVFVPRVDDDNAYFKRGWYKVVNIKPQYDVVSQVVYIQNWTTDEVARTITANYIIQPRPEDTRKKAKRYSKLRITLFCMDQGIWKDVKAFLEESGYYDLFVMAQYFLDTDDYFQRGVEMFLDSYSKDDYTREDLKQMIEVMLNFAFDGYEILNEDAEEELDTSSTANNAGL